MSKEKVLSVRIHNITKSCVLVWKFGDVWALPTIDIPVDSNPSDHLNEIFSLIQGNFELISAVQIVDFHDKIDGEDFHSTVYDIKYVGTVMPTMVSKADTLHTHSQWMQKSVLRSKQPINIPLSAYIAAENTAKEK